MKFRLLLPAIALLVIILAACGAAPVLRNEKWLHDTSLVSGEPCAAPCWRGITPGETLWSDAIEIIENDSTLTELQIEEDEESEAKGAVWQEVDGEQCCQMFTEDGDIVQSVLLRTAPEMKLGDVIDRYGEPDYVVGSEVDAEQAVMNLFYNDPPMLLYVFVAGSEAGALSQSSEIVGVLYLTAETMQDVVDANSLYAWQGFQSFATYASSEFAVTAMPTNDGTPGADDATDESSSDSTEEAEEAD